MQKSFTSRGFTLIELLVVIAIIGILSSVVLASLSTARAKSRDARRIADIDQVRTALELYNDSYGAYPTTNSAGAGAGGQAFSASTGAGVGIGAISPAFMSRLPSDPTSGASYYYCPTSIAAPTVCDGVGAAASSTAYVLGANLERTDNTALKTDSDKSVSTYFYGGGSTCSVPTGTEKCFDITN
jgi:type II secretion system protein G